MSDNNEMFTDEKYYRDRMHYLCTVGRYQEARYLLEDYELDLNKPNKVGCTFLMFAADCGGEGMIRLLLDNGADRTIRDKWNFSALDYAKKRSEKSKEAKEKYKEAINLLINYKITRENGVPV